MKTGKTKEGWIAEVAIDMASFNMGKTYTGFTPVSGIFIGDRVTVSGGATFIVKGVKDWIQAPIPHLELLLFEGDE